MKSRIWLFFCITLLVFALNVSAISGTYDITVAENGNSFVFLSLAGNGTIHVPLPLDVESLNVENAIYIQAENGIDILLSDDSAVVTYTSALLTSKTGDEWNFETKIPDFDSIYATVSLPRNVIISKSSPKNGFMKNLENSTDISWELQNPKGENISVYYLFSETTEAKITLTTIPEELEEKKEIDKTFYYFIVAAMIMVLILYYLFVYRKSEEKKEDNRKDEIVLSKEKRNVMKTLSGNEIKIINVLLENKEKMLRNDLEKVSGIPKSSLSVAINNLERKNVIQVDKSEWTHEVELTEWFKSL